MNLNKFWSIDPVSSFVLIDRAMTSYRRCPVSSMAWYKTGRCKTLPLWPWWLTMDWLSKAPMSVQITSLSHGIHVLINDASQESHAQFDLSGAKTVTFRKSYDSTITDNTLFDRSTIKTHHRFTIASFWGSIYQECHWHQNIKYTHLV